jgi:hypothetical protein
MPVRTRCHGGSLWVGLGGSCHFVFGLVSDFVLRISDLKHVVAANVIPPRKTVVCPANRFAPRHGHLCGVSYNTRPWISLRDVMVCVTRAGRRDDHFLSFGMI